VRKWSVSAVVALLLTVGNAQTQLLPEPRTVVQCLDFVQQYSDRQESADLKAGRKPDYRAYSGQARAMAKLCAASFKVAEVVEADLPALARLYIEADEPALAREAISRRLSATNLSEAELADALGTAVVVMTRVPRGVQDIRLAEQFTARLDALSNGMLKQKLAAHKRMAGYYGSADLDEARTLAHNVTILELVSQLPSEERDKYARQNLSVYDRIAAVYANRGQTEKALEMFRKGRVETLRQGRAAADGTTLFDRSIERYSLLGQRGAPLTGTHWMNAAPGITQLDLRGRVTLIQFTAHWCAPCRQSYPDFLKLHKQFGRRGLDVVMSTQLYGYFAGRQNLKPEEEMAANREYYLRTHKLPFKIAVDEFSELPDRTTERRETNSGKYFVGGIPQIVLLDKLGIVRMILVGWGPDNEMRATRMIEQLLKEPPVSGKR